MTAALYAVTVLGHDRPGIIAEATDGLARTEWLGQPIPLELEHRDGNSSNNELENLELLCPNCHAQTYRSRNRKRA